MSSKFTNGTNFTISVKNLSKQIYGKSAGKESMLERAIEYFNKPKSVTPQDKAIKAQSEKDSVQIQQEIEQYKDQLEFEREQRYTHLESICRTILELSEGDTFKEDVRKSSQILATVQLLSPTEGSKIQQSNELNKPLYKAIICLRVLDRLCMDSRVGELYVKERLVDLPSGQYSNFATVDPEGYKRFVDEVKIPLIKAALLQDIGNTHPDAQRILKGDYGTESPFRILNIEERKRLLQVDYRETVKYLIDGIGVAKYKGNYRKYRDEFNQTEKDKLRFIKALLKGSVNPKKGIGNLLKVPQIYTSMILSTKLNYNYTLIPYVYRVLEKNAERGVCSRGVINAMHKITGDFPMGYGVVFIAENLHGELQQRYEYAIVNYLYPLESEEPICRTVTRNLSFISHGQDLVISKERNLHFTETSKKLNSINKERLNEILQQLSSNYTERKQLDLIPRCWTANEYFSIKTHQKLWDK